jgi:ABC-type phosphate transport system ATPase subunit
VSVSSCGACSYDLERAIIPKVIALNAQCSALDTVEKRRTMEGKVGGSVGNVAKVWRTHSCCSATRDPRISGGLSSALYSGTIIESEPTPRPVTKRPARMYE